MIIPSDVKGMSVQTLGNFVVSSLGFSDILRTLLRAAS
jgi:hypothetical protein